MKSVSGNYNQEGEVKVLDALYAYECKTSDISEAPVFKLTLVNGDAPANVYLLSVPNEKIPWLFLKINESSLQTIQRMFMPATSVVFLSDENILTVGVAIENIKDEFIKREIKHFTVFGRLYNKPCVSLLHALGLIKQKMRRKENIYFIQQLRNRIINGERL